MKKNLKRFVGAALTAAMLFSVSSISTFAEDDPAYSITINETGAQATAHTYKAYQIFKGDVQGTGSNAVLANLNWADDFDGAGFLAVAQTELNLTAAQAADASSVAKWLSENKEDADKVKAFADLARKHLGTTYSVTGTSGNAIGLDKAGYYLVVDETNVANAADLSKSALILAVLGNETVNAKDDLPTVDKFVMDINDSEAAAMDHHPGHIPPFSQSRQPDHDDAHAHHDASDRQVAPAAHAHRLGHRPGGHVWRMLHGHRRPYGAHPLGRRGRHGYTPVGLFGPACHFGLGRSHHINK